MCARTHTHSHTSPCVARVPLLARALTFELVEDGPEFGDVRGEGDVGVEHDDPLEVRGQRLGEHQLHQPVDPRVVFVGDPRYLRLKERGGHR